MKISIIGPTYPFRGGISHYTTLLCKTLRKYHKVQFISYTRQYPAFLFPGSTDKDPSAKPLSIDEVEYLIDSINPFTWIKAVKSINSFRPELLLVPWWVIFWVPPYFFITKNIKKKTGAKIVFLCHNVVEHEANFLKVLGSKLVLRLGDRILTQSKEETERARTLLGTGAPVETVCHPVYKDLAIDQQDKFTARKKLGITSQYVLLFFGFVRHYKGLDILLDALPMILRQEKDLTLVVAGEFWESKDVYNKQMERLGIGGHVIVSDRYIPNEDVGCYFSGADLVVLPYRSMTGSGICQLAFAYKRPVIASDKGSMSEIISDGVNGRIFKAGDAKDLAQIVLDTLNPETLQRLQEGSAKSGNLFSWDNLATVIAGAKSRTGE